MTSAALDPLRMRRLLESGRALVADLDPQAVLERALAAAREVTGARYAALGLLDEQQVEFEQFLTLGVDDETRARIGEIPHGLGVIGMLVSRASPLRLSDVARHSQAHGFPEGPPEMRSFLGAPILIRGAPRGALYLADKEEGAFTAADQEAAVILAEWAATATENAHRYRHGERRRVDQERARGSSGARRDVTIRVGAETGLERVLALIMQRGRALLEARDPPLDDGSPDADGELLSAFAASAAAAAAMARSSESDRLRSLMTAADAERGRWARELHDETLQGLGAVRLLLAAARRRNDHDGTGLAVDEAIGHLEREIQNLNAIISDLRPAALDELGLRPALEALFERRGEQGALVITSRLVLPDPNAGDRLDPTIESTVYRVVQEALTNVVRHANAQAVDVAVTATAGAVSVEIRDDGHGFAADSRGAGFGLEGMRERVHLAGGNVRIESGDEGTRVRAELPAHGVGPVAPAGLRQAATTSQ